jgi:phage baseplate assembly protein W
MIALKYPFQVDLSGKLSATINYDEVVRGQVIDALMTNQGERVMRPRYGCDIQAALFDPQDELARKDGASIIKNRLTQLVSRAMVRNVTMNIEDSRAGAETVFTGAMESAVVISVVYRSSLYATDTTLSVPTSSEFVTRQRSIQEDQT